MPGPATCIRSRRRPPIMADSDRNRGTAGTATNRERRHRAKHLASSGHQHEACAAGQGSGRDLQFQGRSVGPRGRRRKVDRCAVSAATTMPAQGPTRPAASRAIGRCRRIVSSVCPDRNGGDLNRGGRVQAGCAQAQRGCDGGSAGSRAGGRMFQRDHPNIQR